MANTAINIQVFSLPEIITDYFDVTNMTIFINVETD
jgi:hypothetical protein